MGPGNLHFLTDSRIDSSATLDLWVCDLTCPHMPSGLGPAVLDRLLPPWQCPSHRAAGSIKLNGMSSLQRGSVNVSASPFFIAALNKKEN